MRFFPLIKWLFINTQNKTTQTIGWPGSFLSFHRYAQGTHCNNNKNQLILQCGKGLSVSQTRTQTHFRNQASGYFRVLEQCYTTTPQICTTWQKISSQLWLNPANTILLNFRPGPFTTKLYTAPLKPPPPCFWPTFFPHLDSQGGTKSRKKHSLGLVIMKTTSIHGPRTLVKLTDFPAAKSTVLIQCIQIGLIPHTCPAVDLQDEKQKDTNINKFCSRKHPLLEDY